MIVVLAGDFSGNRILTAGDLVRQRIRSQSVGQRAFGRIWHCTRAILRFHSPFGTAIPNLILWRCPTMPDPRETEAADVLAALSKRHAHRIDIVTSDYHTRRAGNIYRANAPGPRNPHGGCSRRHTSPPTVGGRIEKGARLFCWNG